MMKRSVRVTKKIKICMKCDRRVSSMCVCVCVIFFHILFHSHFSHHVRVNWQVQIITANNTVALVFMLVYLSQWWRLKGGGVVV